VGEPSDASKHFRLLAGVSEALNEPLSRAWLHRFIEEYDASTLGDLIWGQIRWSRLLGCWKQCFEIRYRSRSGLP
jgi:hypothetical protein